MAARWDQVQLQVMDQRAQTVDIGARRTLRFAILLWRRVARRTERNRIMRLPRLEDAGNAEVNQEDMSALANHHIGGFEVAENDRRLVIVQVAQHIAQLLCPCDNLLNWQRSAVVLLR